MKRLTARISPLGREPDRQQQAAECLASEDADRPLQILIESDSAQLAHRGAALFLREACDSTRRRGRFAVALSGGATPRPLHRLLADPPIRDRIPWTHTHVFWVDERRVPLDDPLVFLVSGPGKAAIAKALLQEPTGPLPVDLAIGP